MKLTGDEARDIVYGDCDELVWKEVTKEEIVGHSRWAVQKSQIFQYIITEKFYRFDWQVGATESQYERPYEYDECYEPVEVVPKEVTIIKWEKV